MIALLKCLTAILGNIDLISSGEGIFSLALINSIAPNVHYRIVAVRHSYATSISILMH